MPAADWLTFDGLPDWLSDKEIDFATDTFVVRIYASASDANDLTITDASAITNELGTANGYTAGGFTVTPTWVEVSAGVWRLGSNNPTWTASGGAITARYAVLIDTTPATDRPICMSLLDDTPADVSSADTEPFIIDVGSGYFDHKSSAK
jgi:hypothetical protein